MKFLVSDFNGAERYYESDGAGEWADIENTLGEVPLYMQGSDQAGRVGSPIFDPKATNAFLTDEANGFGWRLVPVPPELKQFGIDWDCGKGGSLAEWQFSNYPFLWNNIIRSEAVFTGGVELPGLSQTRALIIVTKSGVFPASNSTLYYEQALAQIESVTRLGTFSIPIRLVGLTIPAGLESVEVIWTEYENPRYDRAPTRQTPRTLSISWRDRARKYGTPNAEFRL